MWSIDTLKRMDPYDFELLIGELFEAMGYTTQVTPLSRDFGVDILIKLEHFGLCHSWIVQAKKYNGSVGVREIREYGSLRMRDQVDGVIVVTTGYFTREAQEEANQYNVKLISKDILVGMLNRYLAPPFPEEGKESHEASDILLHENEEVLHRAPVILNGNRCELVVSNRNIFLKEVGFLSKRAVLKHKLPVSKIIGALFERNRILFFIGGEEIRICSMKGDEKIIEVFHQVRSAGLGQSEKLIKYSSQGPRDVILTNKRLFYREKERVWQVPLVRISGVEAKRGLIFGSSKIFLHTTGERMEHREFTVDDALAWKSDIESAVRSS